MMAGGFLASVPAAARACSKFGKVRPSMPSVPICMNSRRLVPSHLERSAMGRIRSSMNDSPQSRSGRLCKYTVDRLPQAKPLWPAKRIDHFGVGIDAQQVVDGADHVGGI